MIISSLLFYLFATIMVICAVAVITVKNPVHSVLALILTFFCCAGIFLLIGAEFIAMIIVIVYVGAIAVLFLFVVMMLNINYIKIREGFVKHMIFALPIILVLIIDLYILITNSIDQNYFAKEIQLPINKTISNIDAIGNVLYTNYVYPFQIAGLILLVAMISSIVLTLRVRSGVRKQSMNKQLDRNRANSIEVIKILSDNKR